MIYNIAQQIAQHLTTSGPWTARPQRVNGRIMDNTADLIAATLRLHLRRENGRVKVTAGNPAMGRSTHYTGHLPRPWPAVTVAATRNPRDIARDLERRLIPAAITWTAEAIQWITEDNNANERREMIRQTLARQFSGWTASHSAEMVYGDGWSAQVGPAGIYELTFRSLDLETAMEMIALVQQVNQ
jgi:hypothetical protein